MFIAQNEVMVSKITHFYYLISVLPLILLSRILIQKVLKVKFEFVNHKFKLKLMIQQDQELFRHRSCIGEDIMNLENNDYAIQFKDNAYEFKPSINIDDQFDQIIMRKLKIYANDSFLNIVNDDELDLMKENEYLLNEDASKAISILASDDLSIFGDSQDLFNDINLEIKEQSNAEEEESEKEAVSSQEAEVTASPPSVETTPAPDSSDDSKAKRYSKKDDIGTYVNSIKYLYFQKISFSLLASFMLSVM